MTILIDADGCPVVDLTLQIAKQFGVPVIILCDTSHQIEREGAQTMVFDKGIDSVDFALVNRVKPGDVVQVRKPPVTYSFKVLQAIEKRVGAKLVPDVMENVTTPDQYELLEMSKISGFVDRARGTGRPTKKERRDLDEFFTPEYMDDFDFDFDEEEDSEEE